MDFLEVFCFRTDNSRGVRGCTRALGVEGPSDVERVMKYVIQEEVAY